MNTYFCHNCAKNFDLEISKVKEIDARNGDILCSTCQGDFVELVKEGVEPEIDSQGNEFLSCESQEEEKKGDDCDDEWEDEKSTKKSRSKKKKSRNSENVNQS